MKTKDIIIGLDLGQQNDYTVLSVLDIEKHNVTGRGNLYKLVYLKRFPLKTSYPLMLKWITWFIEKAFLNDSYIMVVDYTGVGRPIVDLLRGDGIKLIALNITGGNAANWKHSKEVSVPKKELISSIQVIFMEHRIKIASGIQLLDDLKKEFLNFKATINQKAVASFNAASSYHDDIVLSISLATWYGEQAAKRINKIRISSGLY
jgi:hypothetical protein